MRWIVLAVLALLLGDGCQAERTDLARARSEVLQADQALARAVAARDEAAFAQLVAEDAVFHGRAISRGRAQVVQAWRPLMAADRTATLTWQPHSAVVAGSGDLAYTLGDWELTQLDGGGRAESSRGSYVTVWRRSPGGGWQAVVDSGSPPQE